MKKFIVIVITLFMLIFFSTIDLTQEIIIPNDSIRIRVIANSNLYEDQELKTEVKKSVQTQLGKMLKDTTNIEEVREILNDNLKNIEYNVEKTIEEKASENTTFNVDFGYNYFPKKTYKGVNYQEGYYESIVISLGKSQGENWWCVLFPPLCLDETEEQMEEIEYKSFVKEILDKYF